LITAEIIDYPPMQDYSMSTYRPIVASLVLLLATVSSTDAWAQEQATATAEKIERKEVKDAASGAATPYLLYHPAETTPAEDRSLLIFLYGAGGSLNNYNIRRPPYDLLRSQLAKRGYYIVVPELGPSHFMNQAARTKLDNVVAQVLKQQHISDKRVHVMGTSMGGGSSLAYAISRPDLIRSVCAVMPMTDFATWVKENPRYAPRVAAAYGGTSDKAPKAYQQTSAIENVDAFAKIPVMLIHGNADPIVDYQQSVRLAKRMQEKKYQCVLHTVEGKAHQDEVMRKLQQQAVDFFEAAAK